MMLIGLISLSNWCFQFSHNFIFHIINLLFISFLLFTIIVFKNAVKNSVLRAGLRKLCQKGSLIRLESLPYKKKKEKKNSPLRNAPLF
jgi:large-conductance mechanosensitive channel